MRFGTFKEQRYFEYPQPGNYQGVLINANMACHAPAGLAAFLLEKTAGTPYLIDPLTHAFQHDPDAVTDGDGNPKSSVQNLADAYGDPVKSIVGKRPLLPSHLQGKALSDFVQRCIDFQSRALAVAIAKSEASKYLDEAELSAQRRPYAVVAPYFFLTEASIDDWLPVNRRAAELAVGMREGTGKVFASIVIDQGVLADDDLRGQVVAAMNGLGLDGFLVWVDSLDEQAASRAELAGLVKLGRGLRGDGKREVINLHGGYFSVLAAGNLGNAAMTGVVHGPEFGEFRGVVPVGGGIPIARYYIPDLHVRVRYRDALRAFRAAKWLDSAKDFHENVCDCDECKRVLDGDPNNFAQFGDSTAKSVRRGRGLVRIDYPKKETTEVCLKHYLQRKRREYLASTKMPAEELLKNLRLGAEKYEPILGPDGVTHLRNWHRVFTNLGSRE